MELVRRSVKVRIIAAAIAAAVLSLVGLAVDGGRDAPTTLGGYELQTHKDDHQLPPGCEKDHKYGHKPKQKCPNHTS